MRIRIAVDAMGGDFAPEAPVAAVVAASRDAAFADVDLMLMGPQAQLSALLQHHGAGERITILDTPEVIDGDEPGAQAIRRKKRSALVKGPALVAAGEADAFLSAGNTGALMVSSKLQLGMIEGVQRPALAALLPTWDGRNFLMLDLGAQPECDAENLVQFALMGAVHAERVLGRPQPRIGLLNIGAEASKGTRAVREAYELLQQTPLNFAGNVEGRDLLNGDVDVLVADGFAGNIALKTVEGTALGMFRLFKEAARSSPLAAVGAMLARGAFLQIRKQMDYSEYGGAPLLGLQGVVIKCHGSSNQYAIQNGLRVAVDAVRERIVDQIAADVAALGRMTTEGTH